MSVESIFDISPACVRTSIKRKIKYNVKKFIFVKTSDKFGIHYMIDCQIRKCNETYDYNVSLVEILDDMSVSRLEKSLERINHILEHDKSIYLTKIKLLISNEIKRKILSNTSQLSPIKQ